LRDAIAEVMGIEEVKALGESERDSGSYFVGVGAKPE
jgi:hypothetical protein